MRIVFRPNGRLLFAATHPFFTLRPNLRRFDAGWSLWWFWFEIASIRR